MSASDRSDKSKESKSSTTAPSKKPKKILASLKLDCKFIKGKLFVFEGGALLNSDIPEGFIELFGTDYRTYILDQIVALAKKNGTHVHTDAFLLTQIPHLAFNVMKILAREKATVSSSERLLDDKFYQDPAATGYVVSYQDPDEIALKGIFERENLTIHNAHLIPTLNAKYLLACNQGQIDNLPKTYHATLSTLEHVKKKLDRSKTHYIKLADGTRRNAMQVFQHVDAITAETLLANKEFKEWLGRHKKDKNAAYPTMQTDDVFLIQEAVLGHIADRKVDGDVAKQQEVTCCISVMVEGDIHKPEKLNVKILFPYTRVDDPNFRHKRCDKFLMTAAEEQQVKDFVIKLFMIRYDQKQQRFPLYWETMVAEFVNQHTTFSKEERSLRLSLMAQTMAQETFTSAEKINQDNIKNLIRLFNILTPAEKRATHHHMHTFFCNTLIGWPTEKLVPHEERANIALIQAFRIYLSGLNAVGIQKFQDAIEEGLVAPRGYRLHLNSELYDITNDYFARAKRISEQLLKEHNFVALKGLVAIQKWARAKHQTNATTETKQSAEAKNTKTYC